MLHPFPLSGPQRVNASCLRLVLSISTGLFKCSVLKSFPQKTVALHPDSETKFVISLELLILVCECAFSFWFLLLYPRMIFVWPFRWLFLPFSPDSACPCIINNWTLILHVLACQTSCNDRPLSQYCVDFLSLYCCRNKYYCWYCWNAYRLFFSFPSLRGHEVILYHTRFRALDPCQFHKLPLVAEGSVMQHERVSARLFCVSVSSWKELRGRL